MKTTLALVLGSAALASASPALAATVIGVYNTGVDANGAVQQNNSAELNYTLVAAPEGASPNTRTATSANGYPIGPWLGDDSLSSWIGQANDSGSNTDLSGPVGNYDYRLTFSLAGFDPTTASITGQWAADDAGVDILLNGVSTKNTANGFQSFSPLSITSGFVTGVNTLDFIVHNDGGPTGLRTELNATATAVPEPATWAMMVLGFAMVGFGLRSRRKQAVHVTYA